MEETELKGWQWWVKTNNIKQLWEEQPSYMLSEAVFLFAGFVTFVHAVKKGGRWPYFWLGTILHGLYADNFWHFAVPEFDNFWHSRTPVMLLGDRMPLHIIFLYPAFIYQAAHAISRLNLPRYAEPFAVGLLTVLVDIPYDITAVKFVHWTWHDTDPNIFDRFYWVPWNSFYFHSTFAASFFFLFHASRRWFAPKVPQWEAASVGVELKALLIASLLGMPGGVLMFVPLYHPLHDMLKIHSEVTYFFLVCIFLACIVRGLLSDREKPKTKLSGIDCLLIFQLAIHYLLYWVLVVFFDPEREVSVGLHEPVGPCNEKASLVTPFGQTLYKRKFLCLEDYDEKYFDFHCAKTPPLGASWYTICGTPFENRAEYITILTSELILALSVFSSLYRIPAVVAPAKKQKTK